MTATLPTARKLLRFSEIKRTEFLAKLKKISAGTFEHFLFLGGFAAIAYGAWMVWHPLGPILGGWFAIKVAILMAAERG